jgi:GNAT superfamily N-acetyltransferase
MKLCLVDEPPKQDLEWLDAGIAEYNIGLAGMTWKPLTILLKDDYDRVVGGLNGNTEWGWLHVRLLYIEEEYRGKGYGSQLIEAAEKEAITRGCRRAHLDTFGFQAPAFYKKHGYTVFGVLCEYPPGHNRYYLQKTL